jgi:GntR family transcriptional regulator of vanillate catabolism
MELVLAAELGVSRTPVRDALARLAEEGLLVYHPNRGFLVRQFDVKDVNDAFTVRATLEGLGCRLACERGLQTEDLEKLQMQLEEQKQVLYGEEWNNECALKWQDLNLDFHYSLLALSDNQWLTEAVRRVRQLPIVFDSRSRPHDREKLVLLYKRKQSQQALDEHFKIVDALSRNQASRSEELMREHIHTNTDILVRVMSGGNPGSSTPGEV